MKKLIFILFFSFLGKVYSQESINPNLITFPVSPEAGRLGNFGNVPVNLFYGQLAQSIELFNGSVGDYNLPINLNYNYAGFRVEETPSIVGLGWQLNLGGVVTREVRGFPDEHPKGYYGGDRFILDQYFNTGTITDTYAKQLMEGKLDTEVDKYLLSVNGINFSFKIGLDGNPVFLTKHNYKLEITRNANNVNLIESFILTDTNSNRYYFEYKETNEAAAGATDGDIFDDNFPSYVSSWQLSKIILNNKSEIIFNYQDDDYYSYSFHANATFRGGISNPDSQECVNYYGEGGIQTLVKRKILTSIKSDSYNVFLSFINRNNQEVYNKITIKNNKNTIVDYYDFTYSGARNTLEKINKNNQFFYEFDYNGNSYQGFINSVGNFPWNQDKWGFANGKSNLYGINVRFTSYIADKTPSFIDTVDGALKSIKYPTGGKTEIFYEQNTTVAVDTNNPDTEPNVRIDMKFEADNTPSAPQTKEWIFTKTFDKDVVARLSHSIHSIPQGDMEITISNPGGCSRPTSYYYPLAQYYPQDYYLKIPGIRSAYATPMPFDCPSLYELQNDGCSDCNIEKNSGGTFIIPAGTYVFKFKTMQNRVFAKAEVILDFYDDFGNNSYTIQKAGGVRVYKTIDFPVLGNEVTKNYDYTYGGIYNNLIDEIRLKEVCGFSTEFIVPAFPNIIDYTEKSYNLMLKSGIPVFYSQVKEYPIKEEVFTLKKIFCTGCNSNNGNGSFTYTYLNGVYGITEIKYPQGYQITTFDSPNIIFNDYPFKPISDDLSLGSVASKKVFSSSDTNYNNKLLVEEKNIYAYSTNSSNPSYIDPYANPNYPKSLKMGYKIRRTGSVRNPPPYYTANDFFIFDVYKEVDLESYKININAKEYLNNTPIEKNTAIEYDSFNQQHKVTSSDSNNNIIVDEIFHPYDFTDAVSQDMVNKNSIAPTIKVVNKKNGETIESSQFNFNQISTNLFKPVSYSKSKGNNALENRTSYEYDSQNGTLTSFSQLAPNPANPHDTSNNIKTVIIWGYNKTLPIAKIENATYSQVQGQIEQLQSVSNNGTEAQLMQELNLLRSLLPEAMVTTYTHIPLVGVSTMTDSKGYTMYYKYDDMNRLKEVKDADGKILSENEYHYKN